MKLNVLVVSPPPKNSTGLLENNNSWKQCKGITDSGFGI